MNKSEILKICSEEKEEFANRIRDLPYEDKGIFNSEMLLFVALSKYFDVSSIWESGRARAQSTVVLSCFKNRTADISIDVGGGKYGGALYFFNLANKRILVDKLASTFKKEVKLKNIEYVNSDFSKLPFGDNSIDIIFAWEVLDHANSKQHFKEGQHELVRVLKKDGLLFFQNPMRLKPTDNHPVTMSVSEVIDNFSELDVLSNIELKRMGKYQEIENEKDLYLILTTHEN
jgi:ubiquinone/menaquinone biosynthesis C-methylase UbiE